MVFRKSTIGRCLFADYRFMAVIVMLLLTEKVWTGLRNRSNVFQGPKWRTEQTVAARNILETEFARIEMHQVKMGNKVVKDWIWMDISDQINVLVQLKDSRKFVLFKQRKYGLNKESFAVLGGLIEKGESPLQAAQREMMEELGMKADIWKPLGRFRTDVNRGAGFVHCFLAMESYIYNDARDQNIENFNADLENQETVHVSCIELRNLLEAGGEGFAEAKWTATAALSLLRFPELCS